VAARPLGAYAADTILSRMEEKEPAEVNIGVFFQCISLGRRAAIIQLASKQDIVNRFSLRGRLAVKIKETSYTQLTEELAKEGRAELRRLIDRSGNRVCPPASGRRSI